MDYTYRLLSRWIRVFSTRIHSHSTFLRMNHDCVGLMYLQHTDREPHLPLDLTNGNILKPDHGIHFSINSFSLNFNVFSFRSVGALGGGSAPSRSEDFGHKSLGVMGGESPQKNFGGRGAKPPGNFCVFRAIFPQKSV